MNSFMTILQLKIRKRQKNKIIFKKVLALPTPFFDAIITIQGVIKEKEMKILIVDDESLTREGLIASVDWAALGIDEIYQADDGLSGLETARENKPDIILCDVRMPRMNGIEMLEQIEGFDPDVTAIFMSGYSDKEYLKAAIQLKAINYIEKPIELGEMQQTLQRAVEQCARQRLLGNKGVTLESEQGAQLAYRFTMPFAAHRDAIEGLLRNFSAVSAKNKFKYITTYIVKLQAIPEDPQILRQIKEALQGYLIPMHLNVIYTEKRVYHIIFHIYGELETTAGTREMIASQIAKLFHGCGAFYISIGDTVSGYQEAYHSYESAVIYLQDSFFFEPCKVLSASVIDGCRDVDQTLLQQKITEAKTMVRESGEEATMQVLDEIAQLLRGRRGMLQNQIKGLYYELFLCLYDARLNRQMVPDMAIENRENIMDIMDQCFSFYQLHQMLVEKTHRYYADIKENSSENPTVAIIREFIAGNYADAALSVKDISDYANLSVSYVCTLFKNETGTTINQYITDFRMRKAKQLLADPRNRVGEVSACVGYNDGNYFAKSFRKFTGLSPSEFREQVVRA
ncbi:DNA-binding response regulator [Agathobacter ruminis]|uniref:Stage 0 sporulation protein A homolog n=2 Tax=Agathobacter ruminis TaxID=1712665 RepID=A0A2G3E255_9FIRM|nr:DNA-binding response regulator [Agathobacter ruminis]